MEDIAKGSFVSKSTVSRFCRRLGYEDYQSMRQTMHVALTGRYHRYDEYLTLPKEDMTREYFRHHAEMLHVVREYATDEVLEQFSNLLCKPWRWALIATAKVGCQHHVRSSELP